MVAFCGVVGMGATPSEPMIRCIKGTGNMFVAVELPYEGLWMARLSFGEYRPHAWLDSVLEQTNYQSGNDVAVVVPANRLDVVVKLVSEAGGEVTLFKGVAPWGSPAEELRGTVWHEMPGPFGVVLGSKTHGDSFWMPEVFRVGPSLRLGKQILIVQAYQRRWVIQFFNRMPDELPNCPSLPRNWWHWEGA